MYRVINVSRLLVYRISKWLNLIKILLDHMNNSSKPIIRSVLLPVELTWSEYTLYTKESFPTKLFTIITSCKVGFLAFRGFKVVWTYNYWGGVFHQQSFDRFTLIISFTRINWIIFDTVSGNFERFCKTVMSYNVDNICPCFANHAYKWSYTCIASKGA